MKTKTAKITIFVFIILLAIFLRFYKLNTYPALNADEASNAYDAYSLIRTGMDQHGRSWPVSFQSFNDFKPGLFVYLTIPFVKILGLNEWSVRLPGAIAGILTIIVLYYFIKELFADDKFALVGSFLLAISPWHTQFSRGGWEVNVATLLILSGFLLLFKSLRPGINKNLTNYMILGTVLLVLSLYTYHATRIVAPLLAVCIFLIYRTGFIKILKPIFISIFIGLILLIPLLKDLTAPGAFSRAAGVGLFADSGPLNRINEQRGEHVNINSLTAKLIHNKGVNYSLAFLNNYFTHFNGEFLFMSGDSIERNKVPETGEMYLFDILLLASGFILIFKNINKEWLFIICWLIIAPVASALTFQSPSALRSQNMVIPLLIICSKGLIGLIYWVKNSRLNKYLQTTVYFLLAAFVLWNFARYQDMYWNYMSRVYPYSSQYGVKELVNYLSLTGRSINNIYITTRYDQPYILFLFYLKYPPEKFQGHHSLTSRDDFGFSTVADFDKYHFGPIDFQSLSADNPNSLIIGTTQEIPKTANIIKKIYGTNGFEYFDVVKN